MLHFRPKLKPETRSSHHVSDDHGRWVPARRPDSEGGFKVDGLPASTWRVYAWCRAADDVVWQAEGTVATGGAVELRREPIETMVTVTLPAVLTSETRVTVLLIDDNKDLVRSFQLYAMGSRYDVVPMDESDEPLAAIEAVSPDLIVLDVEGGAAEEIEACAAVAA